MDRAKGCSWALQLFQLKEDSTITSANDGKFNLVNFILLLNQNYVSDVDTTFINSCNFDRWTVGSDLFL
jgi:hypothetical protein